MVIDKKTKVAIVANNQVSQEGLFSDLFPGQPLPVNSQWLTDNSVYLPVAPPYDSNTQRVQTPPVYDSYEDKVFTGTVVNKSDAERIAELKSKKLSFIRSKKSELQNGRLAYGGRIFQIDLASRVTISGAVNMLGIGITNPHGGAWTDVSNIDLAMDDNGLKTFAATVGAFYAAVHDHKQSLQSQIEAATTLAEVTAIDETAGWPDNGIPAGP